ncbi:hypothetical protein [Kitasatospora camelliae]|uniref:Universal stress protein family protein n=1 Tax=Kitasatospora camelliae TaxID=3156397 RepID=A0AAU8JTJ8_9ACTN
MTRFLLAGVDGSAQSLVAAHWAATRPTAAVCRCVCCTSGPGWTTPGRPRRASSTTPP